MDRSDWKDTPLLSQLEVLEVLDAQSQVLKAQVLPHGAANTMCAPREVVLQQMWREEEDGTFIVLLHSTKHRKAAMPPASWSWWQPIRAQMASAGFTIAPLSTKYQAAGGSQECLVTMVLKLDLGGWLSEQSRMGWLLRPFMHGIHSSYLEPMLMSVIALRDKVEQDRFTVKPFSMGQQSDPEKYERTTTMVMRSKSTDSRNWNASAFQPSKLAAVRTNLVADASSSAEPLVQHVNADGETVATTGEEGDGGGPATQDATANLGTCDPKYWSCPGAAGYKVRGQTYLKDKKKIEADEPVFGLASVDLVEVEAPTWHIAQHLPAIRDSKAPFTFVVQLMVPGPPFLSLTMAWAADYDPSKPTSSETPQSQTDGSPTFSGNDADSDSELVKSPFDLCLARFLAGDDKEAEQRRSCMFKLIPSVVKGSWVIKQAVGNTPVLLGKKLTTRYYRGPGHFEVDVDALHPSIGPTVCAIALEEADWVVEAAHELLSRFEEENKERIALLLLKKDGLLKAASAVQAKLIGGHMATASVSADGKKRKHSSRHDKHSEHKKHKSDKHGKAKAGIAGHVASDQYGRYGIIREADLATKVSEFQQWATEVKKVNIEALPKWEEKELFAEFMEDYNTGTLPHKKYYDLMAYAQQQAMKAAKKGRSTGKSEKTMFDDEEERRRNSPLDTPALPV
ncbi:hypothetical protein WJX79_010214 [Trebouxia sp. C0005]